MDELLTERQREIAALVALGMCNKEIARALHITEGTVKLHLHQIFIRLGIHKRIKLMIAYKQKES